MKNDDVSTALRQMDQVLSGFSALAARTKYVDFSDVLPVAAMNMISDLEDVLARWSPVGSSFHYRRERIVTEFGNSSAAIPVLAGVLRSLQKAISNDNFGAFEKIVRAEVFSNFIEQADYLITSGFKEAGAGLIGGVLEQHLRNLAGKFGVAVITPEGKWVKAETVNAALKSGGAYDGQEQKNVTSLLGFRNIAAHGNVGPYDAARIHDFYQNIVSFLARNPL